MKWIKDRKPPKPSKKEDERLNIKFNGVPNILLFDNGHWVWLIGDANYFVTDDEWELIEWLDESINQDRIKELEADIKRLEKIIEAIPVIK